MYNNYCFSLLDRAYIVSLLSFTVLVNKLVHADINPVDLRRHAGASVWKTTSMRSMATGQESFGHPLVLFR